MAENEDTKLLQVQQDVKKARAELKNIRQQCETVKRVHQKEVKIIKDSLKKFTSEHGNWSSTEQASSTGKTEKTEGKCDDIYRMKPIGFIKSIFQNKNGIPRQPTICEVSKATLTIEKSLFNNPEHSLEGITAFSHVWVIFLFHKNNNGYTKAKVKPPRLDGQKVGLFSTRTPYRPNPVGLSLVKLETVSGSTLHLSSVDLLDGTPVLDVKPYIPDYDRPHTTSPPATSSTPSAASAIHVPHHVDSTNDAGLPSAAKRLCLATESPEPPDLQTPPPSLSVAEWIHEPPISELSVTFTSRAEGDLAKFSKTSSDSNYRTEFIEDAGELRKAIASILKADPRSPYRRKSCGDRLYYFSVDTAHVTCWFDESAVEVLAVKPVAESKSGLSEDK